MRGFIFCPGNTGGGSGVGLDTLFAGVFLAARFTLGWPDNSPLEIYPVLPAADGTRSPACATDCPTDRLGRKPTSRCASLSPAATAWVADNANASRMPAARDAAYRIWLGAINAWLPFVTFDHARLPYTAQLRYG
jgi:hypothetical protein